MTKCRYYAQHTEKNAAKIAKNRTRKMAMCCRVIGYRGLWNSKIGGVSKVYARRAPFVREDRMKILVSACLLGVPCRYDGASKPNAAVIALAKQHQLIPVCPEVEGGLSTPRSPAELQGERVQTKEGKDVTAAYQKGAKKALLVAMQNRCTHAILKEKSPSCGKGLVYDGTFSQQLTKGDGLTAACLMQHGITVYGESEILLLGS